MLWLRHVTKCVPGLDSCEQGVSASVDQLLRAVTRACAKENIGRVGVACHVLMQFRLEYRLTVTALGCHLHGYSTSLLLGIDSVD
jgi:hypothetical protein